MGMPPEGSDSVARARTLGSAATPQLTDEIRGGGVHALLAIEALRAADPSAYGAMPAAQRAAIYADALSASRTFNAWGLPGFSLTDTARAVIALGPDAVGALRPLLADERPAPLFGSQDATTSAAYGNRVRDYAFVLIAEILGVAYEYDESPAARDAQIAALPTG
jgi:hypothetical protein